MPTPAIQAEPGSLEHVPITELATFLNGYGLELVYKPDGLFIRRQSPRPDVVAANDSTGHHLAGAGTP